VEESRAEHPLDIVSLARVLERAALDARSQAEYRRALDGGDAAARLGALVALASRAKRSGDHDGRCGSGSWRPPRATAGR
jgi:hypothetical protein